MSAAVQEQKPAEFDAKAFMESRNKGEPAPKVEAKVAEPAPAAEVETVKPKHDSTRSQRRALRAAEERTANLVLKVLGESGVLTKKPSESVPEVVATAPKRSDFPTGDDGAAEFFLASQKFNSEKEKSESEAKEAEQQAAKERYQALDAKTAADIQERFPDWDKLAKEWAANEDIQSVKYEDIPTIVGLLGDSDLRASVSYYWMQNPEEFLELCDLPPKNQISAFHRLEGRLEKMYDSSRSPEKAPTAAQAGKPEKATEDRTHLAEAARPGEPQREVPAKPKPSSEVAARGGSPAPDAPKIGSPEWMLERNRAQFGR